MMGDEIVRKLLNLTEEVIQNTEMDDSEDDEIILSLLDCVKSASGKTKKKKRVWVKEWRRDRENRGTFSFVMKELIDDKSCFLNYIRMTQETFNFILSKIGSDIKKQDTMLRKAITPEEKLAATLRYLATGESYKTTDYQTRLSSSFLSGAIPEVCEAIWKHFKDDFLKFPKSKSEWESIADNFTIKWQFPHCLGALDGKHIAFKSLRRDRSNSIVLLALVDADCRYIYFDVGCNGRTHDAGVLLQSDLKKVIDNAENCFPAAKSIGNGRILPYVIVGDDAFPLQKHIMKPYSYNTTKTERKIFNIRLARARNVVERAFGIMSSRFRIFLTKMNLSVEKVELITKTCCVLHNLLISSNNENYLNEPLPSEPQTSTQTPSNADSHYGRSAAQTIRQGFEDYFNNEGKLSWEDNKL